MDLGFNLAQSNRDLKDPTSRQNFGDTSGLLCKNDPILRHKAFIRCSVSLTETSKWSRGVKKQKRITQSRSTKKQEHDGKFITS